MIRKRRKERSASRAARLCGGEERQRKIRRDPCGYFCRMYHRSIGGISSGRRHPMVSVGKCAPARHACPPRLRRASDAPHFVCPRVHRSGEVVRQIYCKFAIDDSQSWGPADWHVWGEERMPCPLSTDKTRGPRHTSLDGRRQR